MTIAERLGGHIAGARFEHLPAEALDQARVGLLDTLGVTLAGTREASARTVRCSLAAGAGAGASLLFGTNRRIGALDAALAKFEGCAARVPPAHRVARLHEASRDIERIPDVNELTRLAEAPEAPAHGRAA